MIPSWLGLTFSIVLGGIIGSFLNACIYRMPRSLSLDKPRRSFCPRCEHQIAWHDNLPVLSYLWLRGCCRHCQEKISVRYPLVELLTAALFGVLWQFYGWPLAPVYMLFTAILLTATFIDFDFLIIPDELTIGGTVAGVLCALLVPQLMQTEHRLWAGAYSLGGAALGFFLLWGVVELGKMAFGRKKHVLPGPTAFLWEREGETARITVGDEVLAWEEIFSRPTDDLIVECETITVPVGTLKQARLRFRYDFLHLPDGTSLDLDKIDRLEGTVRSLTIPREAMGFGDVKFIAAIGAFLGWQAVLFTIFAASITGCVAGLAAIVAARGERGQQIPFGPFLALGALIWLLGGDALWDLYFANFAR
jgi:leader peptidase (prepilin peptidase)/N-methyltransferase